MDNSQCKKPVKSFKCKFIRRITCIGGKNGGQTPGSVPLLQKEEYLDTKKFEGCDAKVHSQITKEFRIPNMDKDFGSIQQLHPDLRHFVQQFTDSADNPFFKVEYQLDVFVKHLSKLEFGMGNMVSFPIEVKNGEANLDWLQARDQNWLQTLSNPNWAPGAALQV